jgi:diaminopimelate epimerase
MKRLTFWKMSGSGNDFIVIDNRRNRVSAAEGGDLAKALCPRSFSVGADGLILIQKSSRADFAWRFFNADGSEAAMCGNGGRCAARFAYLKGIASENMCFETGAGLIKAEVRGRRVKLQLPDPYGFREKVSLKVGGRVLEPGYMVVGVPHAVLNVDDIEAVPVQLWGRAVRRHREFAPEGTNVNFYQLTGSGEAAIRTYERGVENETLACGTGSVATALVSAAGGEVRSPVRLATRGGEELTVYFRRRGTVFSDVYLEGEADLVFEGKTWEEDPAPRGG